MVLRVWQDLRVCWLAVLPLQVAAGSPYMDSGLSTQPALFHTVPQLGGLYMQDLGQVMYAKSVSIALTTFYKGWLLVSG